MSRSLRIAIADDEPEVREYFAKSLARIGHSIVGTAENGRQLVELCRNERPDLMITDIRMDELSGIEAMKELAKDGPIPTILISAHFRAQDVESEVDGQLVAFLPKPIKFPQLRAAVDEAADFIR